jgi:ubiquinone biosynthesis accessory factor UbiK
VPGPGIKELRTGGHNGAPRCGKTHPPLRYRGAAAPCDYAASPQTDYSMVGGHMSFMNSEGLDDLARRLADSVPESLRAFGRDMESNFKAVLQAQLSKLDLVTRQDFDVQAAILERTQSKLTELEGRLKDIEGKLSPS